MQIKTGEIIEGKITGITKYGAFVSIDKENAGMIHISEISDGFIKDINERLKLNQTVKAVVINVNQDGKLALSMKQAPKDTASDAAEETAEKPGFEKPEEFVKNDNSLGATRNFEDMLNKFKKDSDEKMLDLKYLEPKKSGMSRRKTNQKYE